ncbi:MULTISPECIES: phosphatase PAP2 family protein [unclassified Acinetobacter]|uniref:phosphatase PAP2 family protein n=1 Tax=unclassified Acinetobacter TaxID=196816 RepID=UPI0015D37E08|nr:MULTISPECIES: phosphatase PAP2 family protein [unclassified Acinetobacter]QQN40126.1 phosphatase PAP2 family protein [Acinetobacter sp. CS-2]
MPYLLLGVGFFLFIFSILMLVTPFLNHFDWVMIEWLSQHRSVPLNRIFITLSTIGGMPFVLFLTTVWCLQQAWYKKFTNVVFIGMGLIGSTATVWLLKYVISRPRPPEMYHLVASYGAAFPSAHSLYAATLGCLAIYLSQKHPQHILVCICAFIWLFVMGISRVYLGVHFPSDVLAGWSISFIWITLLYLLYAKLSREKRN